MKFSINRSDFTYATSKIVNVIPNKNIKPILSGTLVKLDGDIVSFTATDMESSINIEIKCNESQGSGSFVVDAKTLAEVSRNLLDNSVEMEAEGNFLKLTSGTGSLKLPVMDVEDYPNVNFMESGREITFPRETLVNMIDKVAFCASNDEYMRNLNGIFWEFSGTFLRMVTADGFRLALAEEEIKGDDTDTDEAFFLLSLKTMKEILNFLKEIDDENFSVKYDGKRIGLSFKGIKYVARIMDVSFPDYKRIIPEQFKTNVVIKRELFLKHLKFANIITRSIGDSVRIEIEDSKLKLMAKSPDKGDANITIDIEHEGANLVIAFNPRFLIEGLQHFQNDEIELNFVDSNNALQMNDLDVQGFIHIVMPVRMS